MNGTIPIKTLKQSDMKILFLKKGKDLVFVSEYESNNKNDYMQKVINTIHSDIESRNEPHDLTIMEDGETITNGISTYKIINHN